MMKNKFGIKIKRFILFQIFFNSLAFFTWAIPPSSIELKYLPDEKKLHIEINHVSHNLRVHHIRKIEIYLNNEEVETINLTTQTSPSQVIRDVDLEAKPDDQIRVLAICSDAGRKEETLVVPQPETR